MGNELLGGAGLFHFTNKNGYNAISSQLIWLFKASQPPGDHPSGAYFTTLPPTTKNLGKRLFVRGCRDKLEFMFQFSGNEGLLPLPGGRGEWIFYSPDDYSVDTDRQITHGPTASWQETQS